MPPREGARLNAGSKGLGPTSPTAVEIHAREAASRRQEDFRCCWARCYSTHAPANHRPHRISRLPTYHPSSEDLIALIQTALRKTVSTEVAVVGGPAPGFAEGAREQTSSMGTYKAVFVDNFLV